MNPLGIFHVKQEERWPALAALLYIIWWNALVVCKYADRFMPLGDDYRSLFVRTFHISGFDPITYVVVSQWGCDYNIYRHPLLAFFMYPVNQTNQALMAVTGANWAQVLVALLLTCCAFYCFLFLYRIFREVVGIGRGDACLLGALTYSFAYVMVGISVPDHFSLSMLMLVLTLYVAGRKLQSGQPLTVWQTVLLFFLTAGISLNNGVKVFLANLFVNGRRFWRPRNLLLAILLPSALLWGGARLEWRHFERPRYAERAQKRALAVQKRHHGIAKSVRDTTRLRDTAAVGRLVAAAIARDDSMRAARKARRAVYAHAGKPINHTEFGQWTDVSTPRLPSLVENVLGESTQLHQDYLLGDVLSKRPVIVGYRHAVNYVVEGILVLMVLLGAWCGRRSRWLWLTLSFLGFDLLIHVVLGFGLNEAYIMSPHWLFILTIAIAFLVRRLTATRWEWPLRALLLLVTAFLLVWNGVLYAGFLLS